jgi:hypothetical protein
MEMERVADWLTGALASERAPVAAETPQLTAYFAGALPPADAEQVERALLRSAALRRDAGRVAELVASLREEGWAESSPPADALETAVRQAWRGLLDAELRQAAGARLLATHSGMDVVRDLAEAGQAQARAAWRAFGAFLERFQAALSQPSPGFATVRGESAPVPGHGDTRHPEHSEIAPDGILSAGTGSELPDGDELTLWLAIGADEWPLASTPVREGRAEWQVRLPLNRIPLHPGPLPCEMLVVRRRAYSPPALQTGAAPLLVTRGARIERVIPDAVRLPAMPELRSGRLHLQLSLEGAASVLYPDGVLEVWLLAGGAGYIRLGQWEVPPAARPEIQGAVPCPEPFPDDPLPLLEFRLAMR